MGGSIPFGGTFLMFNDYMKPAYRLAHLMGVQSIFVFTHDSIGQGEDGPTHQPVETLAAMRATPNACVIRPGDCGEVPYAWLVALERKNAPTALVLTRQAVPTFDRTKFGPASGLLKGAYILSEAKGGKPQVILIGTGSEVQLCVKAQEILEKEGIAARVVSAPSLELFAAQPAAYQEEVLPSKVQGPCRRGSRHFLRLAPLGRTQGPLRDAGALRRQRSRQRGHEEPGLHPRERGGCGKRKPEISLILRSNPKGYNEPCRPY